MFYSTTFTFVFRLLGALKNLSEEKNCTDFFPQANSVFMDSPQFKYSGMGSVITVKEFTNLFY